jgi:hypothetical protein
MTLAPRTKLDLPLYFNHKKLGHVFFHGNSSAPGTSPDPEKEIHDIANFLKLPKLGDCRSTGVVEFCPGCWGYGMAEFICGMVGLTFCFKAMCRPSPLKTFSKLQKKTNFQEEKFG